MKTSWRKLAIATPWGEAAATPSDLKRLLARAVASPIVLTELAPVALVTALAAIVRVMALTDIPPGLHGDEGLAGLDAQRIIREGWIGVYLPSALGTPSGTFYWSATVFRLFGVSMFTDRLAFAVLGIATIPLTYMAFRFMFDRRVGILAATILAVMSWHVHLSRVAFTPVSWPLMEMGALAFLAAGFRTRRWPFFALAGLFFGGGPYGYTGFPIFMIVVGFYLLFLLYTGYRQRLLEFARYMAVFAVSAFLIALPLIAFAKDSDSPFWDKYRLYSITRTPEYQAADDLPAKVDLFAGRAKDYFRGFVRAPGADGVDALGIDPILDRVSPFLMIAGVAIACRNWRRPEYLLPLLMLLIVPNAALWSVDGMYRRTLGLAPFMALLAALPLALAWKTADRWRPWAKYSAYYAIAACVALVGYLNLNAYYDTYSTAPEAKWAFVHELTEASEALVNLDTKPYVYFYSGRWSFNYETRQFLAPAFEGEDRSEEFSTTHTVSLDGIDRSRDTVLLFLPPYQEKLPEALARYPGGQVLQKADSNGVPLFVAYHLPALGTAAPTPVR